MCDLKHRPNPAQCVLPTENLTNPRPSPASSRRIRVGRTAPAPGEVPVEVLRLTGLAPVPSCAACGQPVRRRGHLAPGKGLQQGPGAANVTAGQLAWTTASVWNDRGDTAALMDASGNIVSTQKGH